MDHKNLNVEDLASNESFIDWVKRSDPEAVKYWDLYISSHPEIQAKVEKARALVLNLKMAEETGYDSGVESIWNKIQDSVDAQTKEPESASPKATWAMVIASFSLLCAAVALWFVSSTTGDDKQLSNYYQEASADFVERINETGKPLKIQLADGSAVTLEARSRLKYKENFLKDSTRQVHLLGAAFFDVVKNPYKPFIVHSNEIEVKVLGTSFRVDSPENGENILVSVKTGKVSVFAVSHNAINNHKQGGIILLPNQQVTYERKERLFEKTLVESPALLETTAVAPPDFVFDNTPIAEVFLTMESAYGVEIIFNEEVMKSCYITAPLGSESMREKLKIICETIGASYEIIDANVVIHSSGCR
jgi:transmembrane sensor